MSAPIGHDLMPLAPEPDETFGHSVRLHNELHAIWRTPRGLGRLSAVNHTIVGRRFMGVAFFFFLVGGVLAMLIRAQLATPESAFVGPEIYNQIFTVHGSVMMFLFAIPMFEGFAMYMLPKMLGARDLAFPRLSAYGFWCYVFGGSIILASLVAGVAPDGGWFMYTPLSSSTYSPGINADVWLLGITFVEISAVAAAVELTVSILTVRAPGMTLDKLPLFAWYILITAGMMLVGFPPLILGSILLEAERAFGLPFFDPLRGGDSLLWQHLFWLFGHPEVYIIFLPAAGAVSMMLPALARREMIGYGAIVTSVIAVGFLSFGLWVHHMFAVGIPHLALAFFSVASAMVAIPTAVQIFAWLATLLAGRPQLSLPMLHLFGFFFVFVCGGLTGVMVAVVPFDWQAHDTYFVVAHLHYVLFGGFVFPMLAAVHYWLPHVTGRSSSFGIGTLAFWLIFLGFNATFLLMHLTGLRGMPRRIETYPEEAGWTVLNLLSSIGGFVMTIGFALFVLDVIVKVRYGERTPRNPWNAKSLEWAMPVPPPSYAFASLPFVQSRAPLVETPDLALKLTRGEGYLGRARHGWQETLGVHPTTAKVERIVILPGPTYLPLLTALATGTIFLSLLFGYYLLAPAGALLTLVLLLSWHRGYGNRADYGLLPIGRGASAMVDAETEGSPPVWAMAMTLVADASLLGSLIFGVLFLWLVAPNWPPPATMTSGTGFLVGATLTTLFAAGAGRRALRLNARGSWQREGALIACAVAYAIQISALVIVFTRHIPPMTEHAHGASIAALVAYMLVHGFVGMIIALVCWRRCHAGFVAPTRTAALMVGRFWYDYTAVASIVVTGLIILLPTLLAMTVQP